MWINKRRFIIIITSIILILSIIFTVYVLKAKSPILKIAIFPSGSPVYVYYFELNGQNELSAEYDTKKGSDFALLYSPVDNSDLSVYFQSNNGKYSKCQLSHTEAEELIDLVKVLYDEGLESIDRFMFDDTWIIRTEYKGQILTLDYDYDTRELFDRLIEVSPIKFKLVGFS